MPLYEYECLDCKTRFEQLVYDSGVEISCRACGGSRVTQMLSTFAVAGTSDRAGRDLDPCRDCGAAQRGACGIE